MTDRFDRNLRFFGEEGQRVLRETHVAIVGVGGLGTHVVQQLALLGVGELYLVDHEELDRTYLFTAGEGFPLVLCEVGGEGCGEYWSTDRSG